MLTKTSALVLHALKYGETRLIVDLFTREHGRLSFVVSLPKSPKARVRKQYFQPLTMLEIEADVRPKVQLQKIRDLRLAVPFASIPFDPNKLSISLFVAEFLYHALRGEQQNAPLYDYVANSTGDIYSDKQVRLIIENEDHETVGLVDLTNFDPKHLRAEIGLVIEKPMRRRGYASDALTLLHQYARHTLHLHQVFAIVSTDNTGTIRLLSNQGYEETARLQQWIYDGIGFHDAVMMQKFL